MFTLNKYGKLSLISAAPAFVLSIFAAYSYARSEVDNPILSSVLNSVIEPILRLFAHSPPSKEQVVSMQPAGLFPLVEEHTAILFFIISMVLYIVAILYAFKAAKHQEFSIWYANSVFCCGAAIYLLNPIAAFAVMAITIGFILKFRGRNEDYLKP